MTFLFQLGHAAGIVFPQNKEVIGQEKRLCCAAAKRKTHSLSKMICRKEVPVAPAWQAAWPPRLVTFATIRSA
jgi:hypothetical protein